MNGVKLPMSTTIDCLTAEDFATALDMMHEQALGTFDRDVAARSPMPDDGGKIRVQINAPPDPKQMNPDASWVAGYVYVCSTRWIFQLTIWPKSPTPERFAHWESILNTVLFDARRERIDAKVEFPP